MSYTALVYLCRKRVWFMVKVGLLPPRSGDACLTGFFFFNACFSEVKTRLLLVLLQYTGLSIINKLPKHPLLAREKHPDQVNLTKR